MQYKNVTLFYASGTGNSFRAASWMAEAAASLDTTVQDTTVQLVPVDKANPREQLIAGASQLVGIYHPTHGLMPPWSMIYFLLFVLPTGRGTHGIVVATRGGIPVPRWVIPGGAGLALFFPMLILLAKGYRLRGGLGVDMPCNVLNIHWGITEAHTAHMLKFGQKRHARLANAVLHNRLFFHPVNVFWELIWCIPFILYPPLPLVYLLIARVFMSKLLFADTSCTGCGSCARHCPREAIRMIGPKPQTPFWTHRCEACMRCMGYCRHKSVQASHLWAVPVVFATTWLTSSMVTTAVSQIWYNVPHWFEWLAQAISIGATYAVLILLYYIFQGLLRFKPLRVLFTYTTFTKLYRRRYHEPATRSKEMTRPQSLPSAIK